MRFRRNPRFHIEARRDPGYRKALRLAVETQVKPAAERYIRAAGGPWMRRAGADLVEVHQDGDSIEVVNTDHAAHLQEFGSVNNPPHAPLRRAARAAGLRLDEQ